MEFIPVKTRILQPPQDDLFAVLNESLLSVQEGDVVLVSSKVVSIHQGRCYQLTDIEKDERVREEADRIIEAPYKKHPITIKFNTFLGTSGLDESNGNGYCILPPTEPFKAAEDIHTFLKREHSIKQLGVIVIDSRSLPLRYGATGVGIAFWGFHPLRSHIGKKDLFGREMRFERSNIVDALAEGGVLVAGETNECQPIVIARDVPRLSFEEGNFADELFTSPEDDRFRALF